jgi:hypothetical protein
VLGATEDASRGDLRHGAPGSVLLAYSEIDGSGGAGDQRDERGLVAFADDPQHPVTSLEGHVLDVGFAGLADPKSVQTEQHRQGGVGV